MSRQCGFCAAPFSPRSEQHRFCTPACRKSAYSPNGSRRGLHRLTSAAISQALVTTDLMEKGCEVYKAQSASYRSDLVAVDGGAAQNVLRVKVKTLRWRADGSVSIPAIPDGVDVLALVIDGEVHYQEAAGARFVSKL